MPAIVWGKGKVGNKKRIAKKIASLQSVMCVFRKEKGYFFSFLTLST